MHRIVYEDSGKIKTGSSISEKLLDKRNESTLMYFWNLGIQSFENWTPFEYRLADPTAELLNYKLCLLSEPEL